ncbi:unnamed protein product [Phytomonas sp. Hart1]|nr:unnamed protein product [Phytomonas sp. Hart1]|eukprot:CCW69478.1 unnamed protein product [Phytomonas sp. isolate Hart1]
MLLTPHFRRGFTRFAFPKLAVVTLSASPVACRRLHNSSSLFSSPSTGGRMRRAVGVSFTPRIASRLSIPSRPSVSSGLCSPLRPYVTFGSTSTPALPVGTSTGKGRVTEKEAAILGYPYTLVDTAEALTEAARCLCQSSSIALDIEAFCTNGDTKHLGDISLIQLCSDVGSVVYLIDVLGLSPRQCREQLRPVLEDPAITTLFFDCRRDVEALRVQMGLTPSRALDLQLHFTALQWRLRGVNRRSGLGYVLQDIAGLAQQAEGNAAVHTAMTRGQRAVWDVRPLPAHFLAYAADDVRQIRLLGPALARAGDGVVSLDAIYSLTSLYVDHYARGGFVKDEPDEGSAEVNESWLERVIGPPGRCAFCHARGHTEAECFKKNNHPARCSFCGGLGHTSRNCYQKYPQLLKCDLCGQVGHQASSCFKTNPCIHCGGFHNSANCHRSLQKGSHHAEAASNRSAFPK